MRIAQARVNFAKTLKLRPANFECGGFIKLTVAERFLTFPRSYKLKLRNIASNMAGAATKDD